MNKNNKLLSILLFLFFLGTLTSQSAMDLFSTLYALFTIYLYRNDLQIRNIYKNNFKFEYKLIAVWFLVIGLGFIFNLAHNPPWLVKLLEFKWLILMFMITGYLISEDLTIKNYMKLYLALFITSLYPIFVFIFKYDPIQKVDYSHDIFIRMGGLLNNPMTYAHLYGLFFMISLGVLFCMWRHLSSKNKIIASIFSIVIAIALVLTFTRGVWISVSASIIIIAFLKNKKLGIFAALLIAISFSSLFYLSNNFKDRIEQAANYKENYDIQRVVLWKTNLEIFKDHPVFGIGYGENARRLREYYDRLGYPADQFEGHAHNQFLHFLAGTGAVGLAVYLIFAFYFLFHAYYNYIFLLNESEVIAKSTSKNNNTLTSLELKKGLALGSIGALLHFHIGGLTESNFEHAKMKYSLAFVLAIILWLKYHRDSLSEELKNKYSIKSKLINWF